MLIVPYTTFRKAFEFYTLLLIIKSRSGESKKIQTLPKLCSVHHESLFRHTVNSKSKVVSCNSKPLQCSRSGPKYDITRPMYIDHMYLLTQIVRLLPDTTNPEQLEALACREGLLFASDLGLQRFKLTSDCTNVDRKYQGPGLRLMVSPRDNKMTMVIFP